MTTRAAPRQAMRPQSCWGGSPRAARYSFTGGSPCRRATASDSRQDNRFPSRPRSRDRWPSGGARCSVGISIGKR